MLKIGEILEVEIEGLASTGKGVAHIENDSIFISLAVPEDILKVKINKGKKSFYEAEIVDVVTPSKHRVKPVCPFFGKCGACDWLNITYEQQIKEKEELLKFYFRRNRVKLPKIQTFPADNYLYYRQKIRLKNGFYQRYSNKTINVNECHIINKGFWPLLEKKRKEEECFGYDCISKTVTQDKAFYFYKDLKLAYHPNGFVQSNLEMNKTLINEILKEVQKDSKILELYSGNGNFSIPLSKKTRKVISVEGSTNGFNLLLENIKENNVTNIDPYNDDAKLFSKKRSKYDAAILDPPRIGSDEVLKNISKLTDKLIYISCDASILVKEVKELTDFKITKVKLIDMFPQTRHFETILVMERK